LKAAERDKEIEERQEDKDKLDAYLSWFEGACRAFNVQPEHWSTQLARL